jgi:hypothetical protein
MSHMKKILALLLCPFSVYALYQGSPAQPQIIDQGFWFPQDSFMTVKVGYQGDYVYDRKMKLYGDFHNRIDRFQIWTNQAVMTANVLDRFEVYASAGSMTVDFWHRLNVDGKRREYESHDNWTVGGGARLLLLQWGNTSLGVDGTLQYANPFIVWDALDGVAHATGAHVRYLDWQVGFALSYTADLFTPYIAAIYSSADARLDGVHDDVLPTTHVKMRSRDHFGMALGCTLSSGKIFDLTFEARLIDEQAVTAAANVKF